MSVTPVQGISYACFGLSYGVALLLELAQLVWPRRVWRILAVGFGAAGLLAQSAYILYHQPSPAAPYGALLLLAWVLGVFYLYGTVHYSRQAWAIFVLPVVIVLVILSLLFLTAGTAAPPVDLPSWFSVERFWGSVHGVLILLASIGISVGFLASVMYLVQARRLWSKLSPLGGFRMLSLERLEGMNRRALNTAFPLLTAGLFLGTMLHPPNQVTTADWLSAKVLSTVGLWIVFLVVLYLRYAVHVRGSRLAVLSILTFALLLLALGSSHPFAVGGSS